MDVVGPLLDEWQQRSAVHVVMIDDQGNIVGKKYWVDVASLSVECFVSTCSEIPTVAGNARQYDRVSPE